MKIVVLGGAGLTGKCAVRDLIESPEVSEVLVGDVDSERLGKFVSILGSSKVTSEVVDVRKRNMPIMIRGPPDMVSWSTSGA
jgi:saccharopine dehydrogenase-like NADP-dependent oxidoreductase